MGVFLDDVVDAESGDGLGAGVEEDVGVGAWVDAVFIEQFGEGVGGGLP